jgi:outer membrane protein assembly factor BamB
MGNTSSQDTIWCLDAHTGREIWSRTYPAQLSPQWYEGGPGATPTVEQNCVFTISKWGDVFCLDAAKGSILWRRDLRQDNFKPNRWGFAGSPLVWKDLVIFNIGDAGGALDRFTGRIIWSNGTNAAGYASPVLFRSGGRESVLIFGAKELVALDPGTGRELWRYPWKTDWDTNNTDPLVYRNGIFLSSFSHGCALLSVAAARPELVYETKNLYNHLSPGLVLGEFLIAFNGEAKKETGLRCLHLPTGEVQWSRKEPAFGSLIAAREAMIVLTEKGELVVFRCQPGGAMPVADAEPVARAKVSSGTCWTPPSLANGLLYVRNASGDLCCFELRSAD